MNIYHGQSEPVSNELPNTKETSPHIEAISCKIKSILPRILLALTIVALACAVAFGVTGLLHVYQVNLIPNNFLTPLFDHLNKLGMWIEMGATIAVMMSVGFGIYHYQRKRHSDLDPSATSQQTTNPIEERHSDLDPPETSQQTTNPIEECHSDLDPPETSQQTTNLLEERHSDLDPSATSQQTTNPLEELQAKMKKETVEKAYFENTTKNMYGYGNFGDDIGDRKFMLQKLDEWKDPFSTNFRNEIEFFGKNIQFEAHTDKPLEIPSNDAIQTLAQYYFYKYGINIKVVERWELFDYISELKSKITEPTYLGCIIPNNDNAHVVPLLLYFSGKPENNDCECIVLDSTGNGRFGQNDAKALNRVYYTTQVRQADNFSCRTGALVILRNSLLALKYHQEKHGFHRILQTGEIKDENIIHLPPEWDYTEQYRNPRLNSKHLAIRTYFSNKKIKQQSAKQFRENHRNKVNFKVKAWNNSRAKHLKEPFPSDVTVKTMNKHCWNLSFNVTMNINTYLAEKGRKMANLLNRIKQQYNQENSTIA